MSTPHGSISYYSLYDRVAMYFLDPFVAVNDGTAVRMFKSTAQVNNQIPSDDLDLYYLFDVDVKTGQVLYNVGDDEMVDYDVTEHKPKFIYRLPAVEVSEDG